MAEQERPMSIQVDFEAAIGEATTKTKFQATVTFASHSVMLKRAGESAVRTMQTHARKGKFPSGRRVPVSINLENEMEFSISAEERVALMDEEQAQRALKEAEALMEALRKRQNGHFGKVADLMKDEPKVVGVKPHTR